MSKGGQLGDVILTSSWRQEASALPLLSGCAHSPYHDSVWFIASCCAILRQRASFAEFACPYSSLVFYPRALRFLVSLPSTYVSNSSPLYPRKTSVFTHIHLKRSVNLYVNFVGCFVEPLTCVIASIVPSRASCLFCSLNGDVALLFFVSLYGNVQRWQILQKRPITTVFLVMSVNHFVRVVSVDSMIFVMRSMMRRVAS